MRRSICTSALGAALLLPALAVPAAGATDGPRLRAELRLAAEPAIYLTLSPAAGELTVRARGVTLDRVPIAGAWLRHSTPWLGPAAPPRLGEPAVLTVRRAPVRAAEVAIGGGGTPAQDGPPAAALDEVEALLDGGLVLRAVAAEPRTGVWRRLASTLGAAWAGLSGRPPAALPALVLQVAPEDLPRLAHLLQRDRRILLLDARPAR